jgi:hypothetical protein
MHIELDTNFSKIITLPLNDAENDAEKYKHLHKKTLNDYAELEDFYEPVLYPSENSAIGTVILYQEILKPNIMFKFSRKFNIEKFNSDEMYRAGCQFYYWENEDGSCHIRFASPYLQFDTITPAFNLDE